MNLYQMYLYQQIRHLIVIITRTTFAIGGQVGNDGNYTCKVCGDDGTAGCENETSCLKVCGEIDMF